MNGKEAIKMLRTIQETVFLGKLEFYEAIDVAIKALENLPSAQPDRSLWFRIGEICVDESKGFISSGRAVEKIRELLREAERQEECQ